MEDGQRIVRKMANVDYVAIVGAPIADVVRMTKAAAGARSAANGRLHTDDERAEISVYPSDSEVVVEVYYAGDLAPRRELSQRIYDYLIANTNWDVSLDSDD